jgi:hypothetical protein
MPKTKKSDSEKIAKSKSSKPEKATKPTKEKKAKTVVIEPEVKPAAKPVKAAKKSVAAKPVKAPKPAAVEIVISVEEISLRAYYIAERRQAMGWPGDSSHDWIEAERQLKAEAKRKAKA